MLLVIIVMISNTFINAIILRFLKIDWRHSIYSGALLAQIGEFSFVLATIGYHTHIITNFAFQITITTIGLTMLISPAWILAFKKITKC
jgi:CPA2 family monovalent cation:H+ antiporter-2